VVERQVLINLVSGFAGAGKTTLLTNLLRQGAPDESVALLLNGSGDAGIEMFQPKRGTLSDVAHVASGCICCDAVDAFHTTVRDLVERCRPHRLVIEANAQAEPARVLSSLFQAEDLCSRFTVEPTICVVDVSRFHDLVAEHSYRYFGQIMAAEVVLLNHADRCDPALLQAVRRDVEVLSPRAWIQETVRCDVPLDILFMRAQDTRNVPEAAEYSCFSFNAADTTMDRGRLERMLKRLPKELFRLKGLVRVEDGTFMLNYVTGSYELQPAPAGNLCQLVFVGRNLNKGRLLSLLERCKL
jgi:G3E family GTPase